MFRKPNLTTGSPGPVEKKRRFGLNLVIRKNRLRLNPGWWVGKALWQSWPRQTFGVGCLPVLPQPVTTWLSQEPLCCLR
jgi:hypothetical protein